MVDQPDIALSGLSQICDGATTQFIPSTGGVWSSTDASTATITNGGLVTGINPGTVRFYFTSTLSNCTSDTSIEVVIHPIPVAAIIGPDSICAGTNTFCLLHLVVHG